MALGTCYCRVLGGGASYQRGTPVSLLATEGIQTLQERPRRVYPTLARTREDLGEQWLQRRPEAGSFWPSWPRSS